MSSYKDLIQQIEGLQKKAEEARKKELGLVVAEINEKIAAYNLRPSDLKFGSESGASAAKKGRKQVAAKYRDPQSGKTWSGRGRSPLWVLEAENAGHSREKFLIG
ncbi:MAG: histone [Nevskia sp.]|nr:histone [Nevskia sp.]